MKKLFMIIPLVFLLCFMYGCQDKEAMAELEEFKAQAALEEQNKNIMIRWIEEIEKGNYEAWDEICSPEFVFHIAGISMNLEEHKQGNRPLLVAFPDIKHEINDIVAEADKIIIRATLTGTHEGEYMGIPPTGNKINYTAMVEARFSEGKVVEAWCVADLLTFMEQLGLELKPKQAEK